MPNIKKIADNYEREYGFMAVNATKHNAIMLFKIHADDGTLNELHQVHDELLRRGLKVIVTKEDYDAGVAQHGVPPAFVKGFEA
jgi:GMP synthase-like glutamine amidotransferase